MCASRAPRGVLVARWASELGPQEATASPDSDGGRSACRDTLVADRLARLRIVLASPPPTGRGQAVAWVEQCDALFDLLCAAALPPADGRHVCAAGDEDAICRNTSSVETATAAAAAPLPPCAVRDEVGGLWSEYCRHLAALMSTVQDSTERATLRLLLVRQVQHYCLRTCDAAAGAGRSTALHTILTVAQALHSEVMQRVDDAQSYVPPLRLVTCVLQVHDAAVSLLGCCVHDASERGAAESVVRLVETAHATLVQSYVSRLVHEVLFASYWAEASAASGPRAGGATRALSQGAVHCAVWSFFDFACLAVQRSRAFAVADGCRVASCVLAPLVVACADALEAASRLPGLSCRVTQCSARVTLYVRDIMCFVLLARLLRGWTAMAPRHLLPARRQTAVEESLQRLLQHACGTWHGVKPSLAAKDVLDEIWNVAALTEDELLLVSACDGRTTMRPWSEHFVRAASMSRVTQLFA